MTDLMEKLKEKGFEEQDDRLIKKDAEYTIIINPFSKQVWGFYGNIDFSKQHLEHRFKEMKLDLEIEQKGISYFLKTDQELMVPSTDPKTMEIMPSIEEMMDQAPYIDTDTQLEGVEVKFLSNPIRTGEWKGRYEGNAKYTIFVLQLQEYPRLARIDCGRNFLSYLRASSLIAGIKDLRGHEAFIKREGNKQSTRYKIEFKKEDAD